MSEFNIIGDIKRTDLNPKSRLPTTLHDLKQNLIKISNYQGIRIIFNSVLNDVDCN